MNDAHGRHIQPSLTFKRMSIDLDPCDQSVTLMTFSSRDKKQELEVEVELVPLFQLRMGKEVRLLVRGGRVLESSLQPHPGSRAPFTPTSLKGSTGSTTNGQTTQASSL